ncbi:MAG: PaaI family thioesterase [Novosphingobium sp.]
MSEEIGVATGDGYTLVSEGEWAGWHVWHGDPFEDRNGPFYAKFAPEPVCAFRAEPRHMNGAGFMHGGCLLTFADSALFAIARAHLLGSMAVTLNLAGDFLTSGHVGELIEARGEVTHAGKSTLFVRGLATADGRPVLSFTGIVRKLGKRA